MGGKRWMLVGLAAGTFLGPISNLPAEGEPTTHLYSWKVGQEWYFSLVPGGSLHMADVEIKRQNRPLRGPSKLKEHLYQVPEGNTIAWQERTESGLNYPPKEMVEDLRDFAQSVGVTLRLQGK
jgi:hypothetical protein